ncbi:MAG: hypothetical protein SFW07_02985 [Gammaproteobacteria bacterium]|nr:hypothetical protein [Gammaproteobacteria bacterium]
MKKILLTTNLDAMLVPQQGTDTFFRVNIGDLFVNPISPQELTSTFKINCILNFLKAKDMNVLIGYAFHSYEEFIDLKNRLHEIGLKITKIFIGIDKENDDSYRKFYEQHSRWLDYHPDYIEEEQNKHRAELLNLANKIKAYAIDFQIVEK